MADLLHDFAMRRRAIAFHLRQVRYAQGHVARWPNNNEQRSYLEFCRHGLAEVMHRYCGHAKPAPWITDAKQAQADRIQALMSIPLPRIAA